MTQNSSWTTCDAEHVAAFRAVLGGECDHVIVAMSNSDVEGYFHQVDSELAVVLLPDRIETLIVADEREWDVCVMYQEEDGTAGSLVGCGYYVRAYAPMAYLGTFGNRADVLEWDIKRVYELAKAHRKW